MRFLSIQARSLSGGISGAAWALLEENKETNKKKIEGRGDKNKAAGSHRLGAIDTASRQTFKNKSSSRKQPQLAGIMVSAGGNTTCITSLGLTAWWALRTLSSSSWMFGVFAVLTSLVLEKNEPKLCYYFSYYKSSHGCNFTELLFLGAGYVLFCTLLWSCTSCIFSPQ